MSCILTNVPPSLPRFDMAYDLPSFTYVYFLPCRHWRQARQGRGRGWRTAVAPRARMLSSLFWLRAVAAAAAARRETFPLPPSAPGPFLKAYCLLFQKERRPKVAMPRMMWQGHIFCGLASDGAYRVPKIGLYVVARYFCLLLPGCCSAK